MTERKQYMIYVVTATLSLTVLYYLTAFTSFTLPFVKMNLSRSESTKTLCLISAVCLALHGIAVKKSWIHPDILKGGIAGAMPVAFYGSMVSVKYSSLFIKVIFVAVIITWFIVWAMGEYSFKKAERLQIVLNIWIVLLFSATIVTFKFNNTRMIRYDAYSNTIGANNCLKEKEQYSANKLHSILPRAIAEDTPFVVMYAYLPPDEKVIIDGIFIKVSVQYAEQVNKQELYNTIRHTICDSAPKNSSLLSGKYYSC